MTYPIGMEEARADAAHGRKTIARLERRKAFYAEQIAKTDESIARTERMLRTICCYYPELAEDAPRKPLADLFGADPDFTGAADSVAYVREGRGGKEGTDGK